MTTSTFSLLSMSSSSIFDLRSSQVSDHLRCAVCQKLVIQACQILKCGCRFCECHLTEAFSAGWTELKCPGGTDACATIDKDGWVPDRAVRRTVRDLEVLCPNRDIDGGECGHVCRFRDLDEHNNSCIFFRKRCGYCYEEFPRCRLSNHEQICSQRPQRHQNWQYQEAREPCSFHEVGCAFAGEDMDGHMKTNIVAHQGLILKAFLQENTKLRDENSMLNDKCQVLQETTEKLKKNFDWQSTKMRSFQRVLANCREQQIDLQATCGQVETRSLLWRIENFQALRNTAERGAALVSEPFSSEPYGYKLRCRLYLNGEGIGKGTHLSAFLIIMKGDQDAVLSWPFCRRVTFKVLDQTGRGEDFVKGFNPDQNSCFQRPTGEMNAAVGISRFIALRHLAQPGSRFLRDDTIFIEVVIGKARCQGDDL